MNNEKLSMSNAERSKQLEQEAINLYRSAKPFLAMNKKAKEFFRNVADFNQWENLKREL